MSPDTDTNTLPAWTPPRWLNAFMKAMLHTPGLQKLVGRGVALITVTGRKTGRSYTTPVSYERDGTDLIILSRRTRTWWRNLATNPHVELRLAGEPVHGSAEVSTGADDALPRLTAFLRSHPRDAKFYGVTVSSEGEVNEAEARAVLPHLVVVHVALDG